MTDNIRHTMTPDEEAAWVRDPNSFMKRQTISSQKREKPLWRDGNHIPEPIPEGSCNIKDCREEATETGRCVRHEAIWQRISGKA